MKFYNQLFPLVFVLLTQLIAVFSAPLSKGAFLNSENLEKRSFYPKEYEPRYFLFVKPKDWGNDIYVYLYTDDEEILKDKYYEFKEWPGFKMERCTDYPYEDIYYQRFAAGLYGKSRIIFNDGKNQSPGVMEEGFIYVDKDQNLPVYTVEGFSGVQHELHDGHLHYYNGVYIKYTPKKVSEGKDIYIHYKIGGREWTKVPGEKMDIKTDENGKTYYSAGFQYYDGEEQISFVFTDGNGKWDNNYEKNYVHGLVGVENITVSSDYEF